MALQVHEYDELKLRFERSEGGDFRVIASALGGEASGRFALPFSELELEEFHPAAGPDAAGPTPDGVLGDV